MTAWRALVARRLESGRGFPGAIALAPLWGTISARQVERPLVLPPRSRVIGIGGPTLGGSGKTPFAVAVARCLASAGERVALIARAYRASPRFARVVRPHDDWHEVGDDALLAARALAPCGALVVVAPSRQAAVDLAAERATTLVVDGLLQTRPVRLARSILVRDTRAPWGSGVLPPAGDLRAPREALLAAADCIVDLADDGSSGWDHVVESARLVGHPTNLPCRPAILVSTRIHGARSADGSVQSLGELRRKSVGLLLGIARPVRIARGLASRGVHPEAVVLFADHAALPAALMRRATAAARARSLDAWLSTPKCAMKVPVRVGDVPVLALDHEALLTEEQLSRILGPGPLLHGPQMVLNCAPCEPASTNSP